MAAALYARVSTDEQAQHGHSIDAQKERLIAYAVSQGWHEYRLYVDEGYSGTSLERPALKSLLRHIEQGTIDTVVVYRLDRLSRRQRDVLFLLEDVFMPEGVVFKSATEPFDTGTPLGKAMIGILAVFAQLERDTIAERTQEGQRKRIQKGMWHGGRVPFGYDYDAQTGKLIVNDTEARLVRAVFRKYLDHLSLSHIAEWLSAYDDSRKWSFVTVRQLLDRETYLGNMKWGMSSKEDAHEAIISQETFERAQRMRDRRRETRPSQRKHLLSGILRCGNCGGKMYHRTYDSRPYKYTYYACQYSEMSRKQLLQHGREERCTLPKIRTETIEPYVIQQLLERASVQRDELETMLEKEGQQQSEEQQLIHQLQERLNELDKRIDRWYEAFERGDIDSGRANARVKALEAERLRVFNKINQAPKSEEASSSDDPFFEAMTLIHDAWPELAAEERRQVLQLAVHEILVYADHRIELTWNMDL
ncbi:recombinase family protein [Alicyclobacillus sp. SO9]|uniref:recombinase family protein n=1 Tax=Alicyclobacillus sp. SO9 TaxID=2665646 RepID=UPI0018E8A4D6|nr:recombinase family protein [Alicyclobacillus sp. SO9]QQE80953.1 recombinase family protein [Alicyclobacillus sp. SO9]